MVQFFVFVALAWGLISCQPDLLRPDRSADPALPEPSRAPGRPNPTIEIPPPI
jgi:hypothetical protein